MAAAPPSLASTFGALYLGSIMSTMLSGFTTNQAYDYFKKYHKKDGLHIQLMVLCLWLLDVFQVGLMIHMTWAYLVQGYADPKALSILEWSFSLELGTTVLVTFIVRCFYMSQLWGLSSKNAWILVPAFVFAAAQWGLGWETSIHMLENKAIGTVITPSFQWILGSKCAVSVLADILITTATCYYLHIARTGFNKTNELINLLSIYTINRGVLAMLWETIVMITYLTMKTNFIFAALHLMLGKLHTASLYALLNNRESLRVRQIPDPSSYTHVELSKNANHSHTNTAPQERTRHNVEIVVTSETIVDESLDDKPYTQSSRSFPGNKGHLSLNPGQPVAF